MAHFNNTENNGIFYQTF